MSTKSLNAVRQYFETQLFFSKLEMIKATANCLALLLFAASLLMVLPCNSRADILAYDNTKHGRWAWHR